MYTIINNRKKYKNTKKKESYLNVEFSQAREEKKSKKIIK